MDIGSSNSSGRHSGDDNTSRTSWASVANSETAEPFNPCSFDNFTWGPIFAELPLIRNICCVGAGYVGGPTAAVIALQNPHIRVTVVDKDVVRVSSWNSKHLPIHEPGLYDVVRSARDGLRSTSIAVAEISSCPSEIPARAPNLFFSTQISKSISEADVIFLSVNTPTKMMGIGAGQATNMSALEGATSDIALHAKPGAIIVEKSTVPCRTAQIIRDTLEVHRPGIPFEILSNPEFLAEGTAIKDLLNPDRILIGSLQTPSGIAAASALKKVYSSWVTPSKIIMVNLWSSELAKLVANAMLAQRISSVNTISAVCERTGANIDEVTQTIGLDGRLGSRFLKAGIGFGGSCFKKDILSLVYLSNFLELPEVGEYWMQVLKINDFQRVRFVKRIISKLNGNLIGKKIAVLGYAFKKDTNDTRESPASDVIRQLMADSPVEIAIFDPRCDPEVVKNEIQRLFASTSLKLLKSEGGPIEVYKESYDACAGASAVMILTDWDQFRYPSLPIPESAFHSGSRHEGRIPRSQLNHPTEVELLALREQRQSAQAIKPLTRNDSIVSFYNEDPLSRFETEPTCADGCHDCEKAQGEEVLAHENVEWARVAYHMREPKWVFDGRGIVDVAGMEKLGFRVETIGKVGTRSKLNDFE